MMLILVNKSILKIQLYKILDSNPQDLGSFIDEKNLQPNDDDIAEYEDHVKVKAGIFLLLPVRTRKANGHSCV